MDAHAVTRFYQVLTDTLPARWTAAGLREISQLRAPDGMLGKNEWLLRADHAMTVGRWYLEGIVDLDRHARTGSNTAHLYQEIHSYLRAVDPEATPVEIDQMSAQLARFAWREVEVRRNAQRERIPQSVKEAVWFNGAPDQRCYLCGYKFSKLAVSLFLKTSQNSQLALAPLPLVDFTRPRGANWRHLRIELDHEIPVAEGGSTDEDNLRLACGWCNLIKSKLWSLYDAKAWAAGVLEHPSLGHVTIPQPLWALRLVAARGECEAPQGCAANLVSSELFIAPRNPKGALTPTNLMVVCEQHDRWRVDRLVNPTLLSKRR